MPSLLPLAFAHFYWYIPLMRDPRRISEIVEILRNVWIKYPEWRLTQLVLNAHAVSATEDDAYDTEDELLERGLLRLLDNKPQDSDGIPKPY